MKSLEISLEKQKNNYFDWTLFIASAALTLIGILSIYSATRGSGNDTYIIKQLISVGLGFAVMTTIVFLPKNIIQYVWIPIYSVSILLLVLVLIIGEEIYGTQGWIRLGGFSLQPAEFAKFGVITALAGYLSSKGKYINNIRDAGTSILLTILPFLLIYKQPDHGSASVILAIMIGIFFWAGFNSFVIYFIIMIPVLILLALKGTWFFVVGVSLAAVFSFFFRQKMVFTIAVVIIFVSIGYVAPMIYDSLLSHQKARIETFINPGADPRGSGYNVIQSMMAVGSGGWTGKGFLQGSQTQLRYIPMQWTDFIYSVPTEEFGFLGGVAVIVLFAVLINRAVRIASETDNKFQSTLCFGIAVVFIYHVIINIGMVMGLTPVMGLPLPFLSYGGTAMILNFLFVGILLNTHRHYKLKRLV